MNKILCHLLRAAVGWCGDQTADSPWIQGCWRVSSIRYTTTTFIIKNAQLSIRLSENNSYPVVSLNWVHFIYLTVLKGSAVSLKRVGGLKYIYGEESENEEAAESRSNSDGNSVRHSDLLWPLRWDSGRDIGLLRQQQKWAFIKQCSAKQSNVSKVWTGYSCDFVGFPI